jgi:hypothetical protein
MLNFASLSTLAAFDYQLLRKSKIWKIQKWPQKKWRLYSNKTAKPFVQF